MVIEENNVKEDGGADEGGSIHSCSSLRFQQNQNPQNQIITRNRQASNIPLSTQVLLN